MSEDYKLSDEENRTLQRHKKLEEEAKQKEIHFWKVEYPTLKQEEKVKYWLSIIHQGMRMQGEATGNPYTKFSEDWYREVKQLEPSFDLLLTEIVPLLGFEFDWSEYFRRTNQNSRL